MAWWRTGRGNRRGRVYRPVYPVSRSLYEVPDPYNNLDPQNRFQPLMPGVHKKILNFPMVVYSE